MSRFLAWVSGIPNQPPLLKAGLGHLQALKDAETALICAVTDTRISMSLTIASSPD